MEIASALASLLLEPAHRPVSQHDLVSADFFRRVQCRDTGARRAPVSDCSRHPGKAHRRIRSSFGISTIYLATAVRDNFPGASAPAAEVIGSEMETHKIAEARRNIKAAGLSDLVRILHGDGLETLRLVEAPVDLLFLDGRKDLYLPILKLLKSKLRPGAAILSDNIRSFRRDVTPFLEYVRLGSNGFVSSTINISDGIELSVFPNGGDH